MSQQPDWKLVANLGDASPLEYGGYFVFEDATGVYPPVAEYLEVDEDNGSATVWRFILDRCTWIDDILSDNKFHPDHPAWFAAPESRRAERPQDTTYLRGVADCCGVTEASLRELFCSELAIERADAYRMIGEYHGFDNLDNYPLELTAVEVAERYKTLDLA